MIGKQPIDKLVKQANQLEQHQVNEKIDATKINGKPDKTEQPLEQEWLTLAQDWQQQSFTKVDIDKLTKKTAKRLLKTKLIFAIDLMATIGIIIYFFYLWLFSTENTATVIYMAFAALTSPIYMYISYQMRIVSWRVGVGTPTSAISAAIEACNSSIQYLQLSKYCAFAFVIPLNWYIYTIKTAQNKPMLLGLILANSILLLMYGISDHMQKKRKNELAELKTINKN